jgi:hypothetical protein
MSIEQEYGLNNNIDTIPVLRRSNANIKNSVLTPYDINIIKEYAITSYYDIFVYDGLDYVISDKEINDRAILSMFNLINTERAKRLEQPLLYNNRNVIQNEYNSQLGYINTIRETRVREIELEIENERALVRSIHEEKDRDIDDRNIDDYDGDNRNIELQLQLPITQISNIMLERKTPKINIYNYNNDQDPKTEPTTPISITPISITPISITPAITSSITTRPIPIRSTPIRSTPISITSATTATRSTRPIPKSTQLVINNSAIHPFAESPSTPEKERATNLFNRRIYD